MQRHHPFVFRFNGVGMTGITFFILVELVCWDLGLKEPTSQEEE